MFALLHIIYIAVCFILSESSQKIADQSFLESYTASCRIMPHRYIFPMGQCNRHFIQCHADGARQVDCYDIVHEALPELHSEPDEWVFDAPIKKCVKKVSCPTNVPTSADSIPDRVKANTAKIPRPNKALAAAESSVLDQNDFQNYSPATRPKPYDEQIPPPSELQRPYDEQAPLQSRLDLLDNMYSRQAKSKYDEPIASQPKIDHSKSPYSHLSKSRSYDEQVSGRSDSRYEHSNRQRLTGSGRQRSDDNDYYPEDSWAKVPHLSTSNYPEAPDHLFSRRHHSQYTDGSFERLSACSPGTRFPVGPCNTTYMVCGRGNNYELERCPDRKIFDPLSRICERDVAGCSMESSRNFEYDHLPSKYSLDSSQRYVDSYRQTPTLSKKVGILPQKRNGEVPIRELRRGSIPYNEANVNQDHDYRDLNQKQWPEVGNERCLKHPGLCGPRRILPMPVVTVDGPPRYFRDSFNTWRFSRPASIMPPPLIPQRYPRDYFNVY